MEGNWRMTDDDFSCDLCDFDSFEHLPDRQLYRAEFDPGSVDYTIALIGALSVVSDTNSQELTPMYSDINLDALEQLAVHRESHRPDDPLHLTFTAKEHKITLSSDGKISLSPELR